MDETVRLGRLRSSCLDCRNQSRKIQAGGAMPSTLLSGGAAMLVYETGLGPLESLIWDVWVLGTLETIAVFVRYHADCGNNISRLCFTAPLQATRLE